MNKEQIVLNNSQLGIKTVFYNEENGVLGYAENGVIYLNEAYASDLDLVNKHEVLHLFENSKQFLGVKKVVFDLIGNEKIDELRKDYYFKYAGLYSEEEINGGVLDNEIVIDIVIGNGRFNFEISEYIRDAYKSIVEQQEGILLTEKARRYLSLNVSRNTKNRFRDLKEWNLVFAARYYEGKDKPLGIMRNEQVLSDAKKAASYLSGGLEDDYLIIDSSNNRYLERYLQEIIRACESKGEYEEAKRIKENRQESLVTLARECSERLIEQYRALVELIKQSDYEDSFKYLILNEVLTKTYRYEKGNRIVDKREKGKTILPLMMVNEVILKVIHDDMAKYDNFADLYFMALDRYKKEFLNSGDMYFRQNEKGYWIKFEKGREGTDKFNKDVSDLRALIEDTPWCTRKDVEGQLKQGDFYVFVDNFGKPRIAVQLIRDRINEVRGIAGGNDQELENEYRQVAIDFLRDNSSILGGSLWLKKEERNQRLEWCLIKIKTRTLSDEEIGELIEVLNAHEILTHGNINSNEKKIMEEIKSNKDLRDRIARYSENAEKVLLQIEEIERNERIVGFCKKIESGTLEVSDYESLYKDILYEFSLNSGLDREQVLEYRANQEKLISLVNYTNNGFKSHFAKQYECNPDEIYIGKLELNGKRNVNFPYKIIVGELNLLDCKTVDLSKLKFIKGNVKIARSTSVKLSSLLSVDGDIGMFDNKDIDVGRLEVVGGNLEIIALEESYMQSIRLIKGDANFGHGGGAEEYPNLEEVQGNLRIDYKTKRMDKLKEVKGSIVVDRLCTIEQLPSLQKFGELFGFIPKGVADALYYDDDNKCFVRKVNKR